MTMIDTKVFIPILTECIKGNREEINELKKKNADLGYRMDEMER